MGRQELDVSCRSDVQDRTSGNSPGPGGTLSASDHRHEVKQAKQGPLPAPHLEKQALGQRWFFAV